MADGGYHGNTHITRRVITQPPWRQEVIRPPPVQEVIRAPPVQYIETVSAPAPAPLPISVPAPAPAQTIRHSAGEDTYHIKLNTNTMNYTKQKVGGNYFLILKKSV